MAGVLLAQGLAKAAAPFAGLAAVLALGAAGAEWVEHSAPFGLRAARDRAEALARANAANWRAMQADRDGWKAAEGRAEAQRQRDAENAAKTLQAEEAAKVHAATDAFDQGVAFGRALKETTNAKTASVAAASPAGGVRDQPGQDFAGFWSRGAYRPAPSLPAKP